MRKIFVTGIGTNVGKTIASAVLAEALRADYWKPVQCGLEPVTDSQMVRSLITNRVSIVHPEAYCFAEAASPHTASKKAGLEIKLSNIILPLTDNSTMIIEGAGGLLVPLNEENLIADLIVQLKAEVIVVVNFYLGSINHTLLTCQELKRRNIPVLGLLLSGSPNEASADIIFKQTGLRKLGHIAQEQVFNKDTIVHYASQFKTI